MVRIVLDKQETDSWLDYREDEPNWIQFKFKPTEFDLVRLEEMSKKSGDIIDFGILRECKLKTPAN